MSNKFQNKYRIPSARLQNWDYGSNAAYFVTICTKNMEHFFGEILDAEMILSDIGKIVESEWIKTPEIRPDMNLQLGEFVVMPNHFHTIIIIGENEYNMKRDVDCTDVDCTDANCRDAMHRVSTASASGDNDYKNKFAPQSKNLASIMRGFKSAVTTQAHIINADFDWQSRFHDHIIRNEESFQRISNYIRNNPSKWTDDKFFTT